MERELEFSVHNYFHIPGTKFFPSAFCKSFSVVISEDQFNCIPSVNFLTCHSYFMLSLTMLNYEAIVKMYSSHHNSMYCPFPSQFISFHISMDR